jgi:hypothetical protein
MALSSLDISRKESTIIPMKTKVKRLLTVVLFLLGTSFATISPASAGQFCADGTWSNSSGRGTCSWHGGILGNTTKKKTNTYSDPWGTSLNNDPWATTKKKTDTYSDPWGTSLNNDPWATTKKKTNTYSDPWGTSLNNDPWGTPKTNTYSDPWGNSNNKLGGFCSSFDRSMGRC